MPLERESVREMLDREVTISAWDRAQVFMWLKRAGRYFPYIEEQLAKEGLPDDLKYLAVAESALIPHIRSRVGAMGHWQFMPQTARSKGLRKDHQIDERRDFEKSTEAAISYLKFLREKFGNWTLAMAAYNCGDSRLSKQMKNQRADSYYRLSLPNETERYIFRIAAVKLILENPGRYGYKIPETRIYRPMPCDKVQVNVSTSIPIVEVAEALGTDFKTIKELNPHILGDHMPHGRYTVRVPPGNGPRLTRALNDLAGAFAAGKGGIHQGDVYVVKPGDTLSAISRRSGVPVDTIRRLNNIDGSVIRIGQRLKLDS
jgi:membrane-bound lytic murein transglycosylase D